MGVGVSISVFTGSRGVKPRLAANLGIEQFHAGPYNWKKRFKYLKSFAD